VTGAVHVNANGTSAATTVVNHLTIAGATNAWTGNLDLKDNDLIINYNGSATPFQTVKNQVKMGIASGNTVGITSATAQAAGDTVLAVIDNVSAGLTSFSGITLDGTTHQILGKYTYKGDANLDGKVTGDDYAFVDANLGASGVTVQWNQGDFNYDDKVTGDDYAFIDANLGKGTVTPLGYNELQSQMIAMHTEMFGATYTAALDAAETAAPEPASIGLLALGAIALLSRRLP
jgi:hypothetical protein